MRYFAGKNIGVDDLGFPVTDDVIRIMPVVIGSKSGGLLQVILERCWWLLRSGQAAHQWLPGEHCKQGWP